MTLEQVLQPDPVSLEAGTSGVLEWFRSRRDQHPKHDVLALLGKGAMGEVLVARDRDLHRMVALKRIDSKRVTGEFDLRRFYTEAQITAQLDHPSIVPVHDIELAVATDNRLRVTRLVVEHYQTALFIDLPGSRPTLADDKEIAVIRKVHEVRASIL